MTIPKLATPIPGRLCLFCTSMNFDKGWGGTDITPGEATEIGCYKGYWDTQNGWAIKLLREGMKTAEVCADYREDAE